MNKKTTPQKKRKKIGIALGGGGARGLAHLGVLRVLEKSNIPIDYIAGTSMGALVGGWYAIAKDVDFLEDIFSRVSSAQVEKMEELLQGRKSSLFKEDDLVAMLEVGFGDRTIEKCQIPFAAIATDAKNGGEVILKKGSLREAVRASTAIPAVFPAVEQQGKTLIDGGFTNPVPADVVKDMGADIVIAVDVSSKWIDIKEYSIDAHDVYHILSDAFGVAEYQMAKRILGKYANVVIHPLVTEYGLFDFHKLSDIVQAGERATHYALKDIEKQTGYKVTLQKGLAEQFVSMMFGE